MAQLVEPSGKLVELVVDCTDSSGGLRHAHFLGIKLLAAQQLAPPVLQPWWGGWLAPRLGFIKY